MAWSGDMLLNEKDEQRVHQQIVTGRVTEAWQWLLDRGDPAQEDRIKKAWAGRSGRTIAARLLGVMGDSRRSAWWHQRNFRDHPDDANACFYASYQILGRFGPLRALRIARPVLEAQDDPQNNPECADLWTFMSEVYNRFRDFDRSRECLDHAEKLLKDDHAWLDVCKAYLLLSEDRTDECLELLESSLKLYPDYRSLLSMAADQLWSHNRDDEAFALLEGAKQRSAHPGHSVQLVRFYDETEQLEKGLEELDEYESRSLRADKKVKKWIAGYRASFLYQLGRGEDMLPFAKASKFGFYKKVAKRVRKGHFETGKRVRLNVPFIRQSTATCAPATLTALSHFYDREVDHLELAEEICYDGTTDHAQRTWAEKEGWTVREFRADWPTTMALIDRGIPFAVTTVEATSAHLQAIVGYDSRAGTLIIRDPGDRHYSEYRQKAFFKDYAHSGPLAMLMVPPDREASIADLELPDRELFDIVHRLNDALENHDRERASACHQEIVNLAPDHRLNAYTAFILAGYDDDQRAALDALQRLTVQFPKAERFRYYHFCRRRNFVTRDEQETFLRKRVSGKTIFTLYLKELADLLADDARELDEACYHYRRALRYRSGDAAVLYGHAGVLWDMRRFEEATELYRFAACMSDRSEGYSMSYFKACRWIRQTDAGLEMLRNRYEKYGHKSSGPAISLCQALRTLDHDQEVFPLIEEALKKLKEDEGELLHFAANQFALFGQADRARELLDQSGNKISESQKLELRAKIEGYQLNHEAALAEWRKLLEVSPLRIDAHRAVANLLSKLHDNETAIEHLEQACAEFPHHVPLHELLVAWLRDETAGRAEDTLRGLIKTQPSNAWAWRELALDLNDQNRADDAIEAARQSIQLQPQSSWSHSTLGLAFEQKRDFESAAKAYREALKFVVENHPAMYGLVRVSPDSDSKREALRFIEAELSEQVLFGETLHAFRKTAWSVVEPDELLEALRRAHAARPDLWETWSVLAEQLKEMGQLEEARKIAEAMTERFPMMPRGRYDLAEIHHDLGDQSAEISAYEKALELNPRWDSAMRSLARALEKRGDTERCVELLRKALAEDPNEAANHGCLADTLWRLGEHDEAFEAVAASVRASPGYSWGWTHLGEWGRILERRDAAILEGERLVEERPTDPESWRILARLNGDFDENEARIDALDRGITLHPEDDQLYDQKAWALCTMGRYDEAVAACSEVNWPEGQRPRSLAARQSWVEDNRGNRKLAIELMEAVTEKHSDYYWAHERLADWYQQEERYDDALKQCRHLVRLSPTDPQPHAYLADLLEAREDLDGAVESFTKAFEIAPGYVFAGHQLVRLHIQAGRYDQAAAALEIFEYHNASDPSAAELRMWLESERNDAGKVAEAFTRLCNNESVSEENLNLAEQRLDKVRLRKNIAGYYYDALSAGNVRAPAVAIRWVDRRINAGTRNLLRELNALDLRPEINEEAWRALVYQLKNRQQYGEAIKIIRKNRDRFRSSTYLWGTAANVMYSADKFRQVVEWMADYRERDDVKPWMLQNLANSVRETSGFSKAAEIHAYASVELPTDHDTWSHHVRAGYFYAWMKDIETSRFHLNRAREGKVESHDDFVRHLAEYLNEATENGKVDGGKLKQAVAIYSEWLDWRFSKSLMRGAITRTFPASITRSGAAWLAIRGLIGR